MYSPFFKRDINTVGNYCFITFLFGVLEYLIIFIKYTYSMKMSFSVFFQLFGIIPEYNVVI